METATPLFARLVEQGFRLEVEYVETAGGPGRSGKGITAATLFERPPEWQAKIKKGTAFVSHNYWPSSADLYSPEIGAAHGKRIQHH